MGITGKLAFPALNSYETGSRVYTFRKDTRRVFSGDSDHPKRENLKSLILDTLK